MKSKFKIGDVIRYKIDKKSPILEKFQGKCFKITDMDGSVYRFTEKEHCEIDVVNKWSKKLTPLSAALYGVDLD